MSNFCHTGDIFNLQTDTHQSDCGSCCYCCQRIRKYKVGQVGMLLDDGTCGQGLRGQGLGLLLHHPDPKP
jgi:hypothetical protein